MAFMCGLETVLEVEGKLPFDVVFVVEGEEELGSISMPRFVEDHKQELMGAGGVYFQEMTENKQGKPAVILGNKGIIFLELKCVKASSDVHSSLAQGIVSSVARIIHAISSLIGPRGEVLVEELYDDVEIPSRDLEFLKDLMEYFRLEELVEEHGVKELRCSDEEFYRKVFFEPSINVDGIEAGYMGSGTKTITPPEARARIAVRLVPNMNPARTLEKIINYLNKRGFQDVDVIVHDMYDWSKTDIEHPLVNTSIQAYRNLGFEPCIVPMMPGSAPFYLFNKLLKLPVVGAGLGYGARAHAPNEYITVDGFKRSIMYTISFIKEYGRIA